MDILVKNGKIVTQQNKLVETDLWIKDDKIQGIGRFTELEQGMDEVIDAKGNLILPGFVDVHVHFREPGFEYKETVQTGSRSAAKGGFTTVCAMPNLNPVPDNVENFEKVDKIIEKDAIIKVLQYASITSGLRSEELVDFKALKTAGAFAFTNDGVGVQTAGTMYLAMQACASLNIPLVAHTEDESLLFGGVMHLGDVSDKLGLPGIMGATESSQIARDVLLAKETGVHYHVCHVSTKESVEIIRHAKKNGIKVTCEVCPHHLILNDTSITCDHGYFKMNPPLRAETDRRALIEGLKDGTIDCIATDHAPHSHEEKNQSMLHAPFGIIGSETAFPLMYTHFVETGIFTLAEIVYWLSEAPAKIFNLDVGTLMIGKSADFTLIDINESFEIQDDFESKSNNTPFIGEKVKGMVLATFVNGEKVWSKNN